MAWVTRQGGLQIHASDGPYAGGKVIHATPNADEVLVAGDWNGDGKDTVAWVTRVGGLQYHPADGPDAGGKMIDSSPKADEYLLSGDWAGGGARRLHGQQQLHADHLRQPVARLPRCGRPGDCCERLRGQDLGAVRGRRQRLPELLERVELLARSGRNPLNTNRTEPGSTTWNSDGVKIYRDYDGHTCWYWGMKANGDALTNGLYGGIISVLRSPAGDNYTQCVRVAQAVVSTRWGTTSYAGLC